MINKNNAILYTYMTKTIDIKQSIVSPSIANDLETLTVVVLDEQGQPAENANVSISPANASGVTNNSGEILFTLGEATKYNITATASGKTVTVPYYVTKDGATRLVVNPVYVKSIETQLDLPVFNSGIIPMIGIGLGIVIILVIVWKLFRRKK